MSTIVTAETILTIAPARGCAGDVDDIGGAVRAEQDEMAPGGCLTTTVECRWWAPGRIPEELAAWFATLGPVHVDTKRRDRYLLDEVPPRPEREGPRRDDV